MQKLLNEMSAVRKQLNKDLNDFLPIPTDKTATVIQAMRYSVISTGKALRPFLVYQIASLLGIPAQQVKPVAVAIEMAHTYSLIHDDLPAMDNDTLRRGQPTCHIAFDEATAILAGDGLLTLAFDVLSTTKAKNTANVIKLIQYFATVLGAKGMIGGQIMDLLGEKTALTLKEVQQLQSLKTGALIRFSCIAPTYLQDTPSAYTTALDEFATALGLLFQVTDDILDIIGDASIIGKTTGKDKQAHKSTFVSLNGLEETKKMAKKLCLQAKAALNKLPKPAPLLQDLVDFILKREK